MKLFRQRIKIRAWPGIPLEQMQQHRMILWFQGFEPFGRCRWRSLHSGAVALETGAATVLPLRAGSSPSGSSSAITFDKMPTTSEVSWAMRFNPQHVDMERLSRPRDGFTRHPASALLNGDFTKFGADRFEVGFQFFGWQFKSLENSLQGADFVLGNNAVSRRHINQNLAD